VKNVILFNLLINQVHFFLGFFELERRILALIATQTLGDDGLLNETTGSKNKDLLFF